MADSNSLQDQKKSRLTQGPKPAPGTVDIVVGTRNSIAKAILAQEKKLQKPKQS